MNEKSDIDIEDKPQLDNDTTTSFISATETPEKNDSIPETHLQTLTNIVFLF